MNIGSRLIILFMFVGLRTFSQSVSGDTLQHIASFFKKWDNANTPGAMIAISRHGQVIYANAWGMADIENNIPNTPSTIAPIASLSKQFTAAAILLLEQEGKLSLDDNIRKYLPALPQFEEPILIRQLLNHTSGLQDWTQILLLTNKGSDYPFNNDSVLNMMARIKQLNNNPGELYVYTNTNYSLLASIVEKCSGLSFPEFCKSKLFMPLNLKDTRWGTP